MSSRSPLPPARGLTRVSSSLFAASFTRLLASSSTPSMSRDTLYLCLVRRYFPSGLRSTRQLIRTETSMPLADGDRWDISAGGRRDRFLHDSWPTETGIFPRNKYHTFRDTSPQKYYFRMLNASNVKKKQERSCLPKNKFHVMFHIFGGIYIDLHHTRDGVNFAVRATMSIAFQLSPRER